MISIRLRRTGAKKDAHYRVVVADSRAARDGAFIEVLGHYHPRYEPAKVVLDVEKTKAWIDKGAQVSDTVKSLLKKVESGAVQTQKAVAPSRHRDTVKHAQIRATAPEPEAEVVAVDEKAGEGAEAVAQGSSDEAEVEAVAEESSDDAAVHAVAEESSDDAAVAPEDGDAEPTAEEDDDQDRE